MSDRKQKASTSNSFKNLSKILVAFVLFCAFAPDIIHKIFGVNESQQASNIQEKEVDRCEVHDTSSLIGGYGFIKSNTVPSNHEEAPWRTEKLNQAGPDLWDTAPSEIQAKTKVIVIDQVSYEKVYSDKDRLLVRFFDNKNQNSFWIKTKDFDPVEWWTCSPDKAVQHSTIIAAPLPNSHPVTLEGRWIEGSQPTKLWCWTWVEEVGVYCEPKYKDETTKIDFWIYKPNELNIIY